MSIAKLLFFGALIGSAVPTLALADVNLVTNGSFETQDFTGWTQFGNTDFTGVDCNNANDFGVSPTNGVCQAFFGPIGTKGGIDQAPVVSATALYTVSFDMANLGGTPNSFEADLGAVTLTN